MIKKEKLIYYSKKYWDEYYEIREDKWNELSAIYPVICICGKLCSGLHERACKKFQTRIDNLVLDYFIQKYEKKGKALLDKRRNKKGE